MKAPLPCRQCVYYLAAPTGGHGQCHGLPPQVHVYKNNNDDMIFEQVRPWVAALDTGCSLFKGAR